MPRLSNRATSTAWGCCPASKHVELELVGRLSASGSSRPVFDVAYLERHHEDSSAAAYRFASAALHAALAKRYAGSKYVSVMPLEYATSKTGRLEPEALNETNKLELYVFASQQHPHAVLVARLDNLGKGASGAAVQNMRLMLGLAEYLKPTQAGITLSARCWRGRPFGRRGLRAHPRTAESIVASSEGGSTVLP